jgi:glycosyltransferase involved in cell wall biosynthesis
MALRREVVLRERFDEELTAHALGEDREMGYRLAPRYWLLEARQARVIHRREGTSRADSRALGFMTGFNTLRILERTCRLGAGDWLIIGWGFAVLGMMHLIWSLGPSRRAHLAELRGMIGGAVAALRARRQFLRTQPQQGPIRIAHAGTGAVGVKADRRMTRVLFVTNRLEPGGAEQMLVSLVARLPGHDVQPHIACLKKDAGPLARRCRALGIPVFDGLLRFKADVAVLARLGRILLRRRIDVVVAAHSGGDRMFWSTLAGRMFGVKVVVWSHWFPAPNERHLERANRALVRCVDAFVALGRRHRSALVRHEGVPAGRIRVIPNAVKLDTFRRAPSRAEARRRLGLGEHDLAIAIIANLRSEKRHDVFIRAARLLAGRLPEARFLIIGDGPQHRAVRAAVEACGLDPEVLRMIGPRPDVAELLPGLDVCCLCSERECFSVTMLEAAAAGCAFIGPDCGSIPEFVEHRRTGLLIRPADVRSLTDALEALATDADLRRRLAAAARERVFREYGIDRTAHAFANLFQSLRPGRFPRRSA